ncbi:hypothetical protein PMAYCL1PPCAC_04693, partial [Pristionchus mayeri]
WGFGMFIAVFVMIYGVQRELKYGMKHASRITQRFQKRAVTALVLQVFYPLGIVPSIFYLIPLIVFATIVAYTKSMDPVEAASNKIASTISSLAVATVSFHTFGHSMTVLVCSPTYRRTITDLICVCFGK